LLDALIAATAKKINKTLLTRNYKHFKPLEDAGHITCEPYKEENQKKICQKKKRSQRKQPKNTTHLPLLYP